MAMATQRPTLRPTATPDPQTTSGRPPPRRRRPQSEYLSTLLWVVALIPVIVILKVTSFSGPPEPPPTREPALVHEQGGASAGTPAPRAPRRTPTPPRPPRRDDRPAAAGAGGGEAGVGCVWMNIEFTPELSDAWQHFTGEKGAKFKGSSTVMTVDSAEGDCSGRETSARKVPVRVGFWGKSSQRLRLTKRRSLDVVVEDGALSGIPGAPPLRRFLLMSMWEDEYRLAYITAARTLSAAGLWLPHVRFVEVHCSGPSPPCESTFGLYLLIEFPTYAIEREWPRFGVSRPAQERCMEGWGSRRALGSARPLPPLRSGEHPIVGARVWRYSPKPAFYDVWDFPSFAQNSTISPRYRRLDRSWKKNKSPLEPGQVLVVEQYLIWLAFNSLLRNGDYDDEVYLVAHPRDESAPLLIHPWDYDTIFQPCHKDGKFAARNQPLFYCAESDVDKLVISTPLLLKAYKQTLSCVLRNDGQPAEWESALSSTEAELRRLMDNPSLGAGVSAEIARVSYEGKKVPDFSRGAAALRKDFRQRHSELRALLASDKDAQGHDDTAEQAADDVSTRKDASAEAEDVPTGRADGDLGRCVGAIPGLRKEFKVRGEVRPADGKDTVVHSFEATSSTARFPVTRKVSNSQPAALSAGLHCVQASSDSRLPGVCAGSVYQPVVVRDKLRGSAEWGVPPYTRPTSPPPLSPLPSGARIVSLSPTSLHGARLNFWPLVFRAVDEAGEWVRATVNLKSDDTELTLPYGVAGFVAGATALKPVHSPVAVQSVVVGSATTFESPKAGSVSVEPPSPGDGACKQAAADVRDAQWETGCTTVRGVVTVRGTLTVRAGAVVVLAAAARIVVAAGGKVRLLGSADSPVWFLPAERGSWWGGFAVEAGGELAAEHTVVMGTGGTKHKRDLSTGKHRLEVPAFTFSSSAAGQRGARGKLSDVVLLECNGPGFGAGAGTVLSISRSLLQGTQQGGECRRCDIDVRDTAVVDVPNRDAAYVDGDNDGLYLSGGKHVVSGCVIAYTADDGIDSGTPSWKDTNGGSLDISGTIIDGCQHEGIAFSGVARAATVTDSIIRRCQQGVEMGYSLPTHHATVSNCLLEGNDVAVRYGDNYHSKTSSGRLKVTESVLTDSRLFDVLNLCRKSHAPSKQLSVDRTLFGPRSEHVHRSPTTCQVAAYSGKGNWYGTAGLEGGRLVSLSPPAPGAGDEPGKLFGPRRSLF
eukprot:TRINITY_DN995_c0_g3_i1.p1 TRINITY_DN995_c0_g3~~TRINITY_DN995_c0_g3_i1.p1  ORF type:complete len:1209 (+),score=293.06 TRINITY_DN995_c0_g3_i1:41-3667(+)